MPTLSADSPQEKDLSWWCHTIQTDVVSRTKDSVPGNPLMHFPMRQKAHRHIVKILRYQSSCMQVKKLAKIMIFSQNYLKNQAVLLRWSTPESESTNSEKTITLSRPYRVIGKPLIGPPSLPRDSILDRT